MKYLFAVLLSLVVSTSSSDVVDYSNSKIYALSIEDTSKVPQIWFDSSPYTESHGDEQGQLVNEILIKAEGTAEFEELLTNLNIRFEVVVNDVGRSIREENPKHGRSRKFTWDAYYEIDKIQDYLKDKSTQFPRQTTLLDVGKTYEKRSIYGLKISDGTPKPQIVIESGIHAREWITPATTTYLIEQLLISSDPEVQELRNSYDWYIFPSINPDGYQFTFKDRMWRKNRAKNANSRCFGVDLNRNWDYHWGIVGVSHDPCDYQVYCGPRAFSEMESQHFYNFTKSLNNLYGYLAYHSSAQVVLLTYSDSVEHVENYEDMKRFGKESIDRGAKVNGVRYKAIGTAPEAIGYGASGGTMDLVKHEMKVPIVATYELRSKGGAFMWPAHRIPEQGEEVVQMLIGLLKAANESGTLDSFMQTMNH